MTRYRIAKEPHPVKGAVKFAFATPPSGYIEPTEDSVIKAWALSPEGKIDRLIVNVYSDRLRTTFSIDSFDASEKVATQFPLNPQAGNAAFVLNLGSLEAISRGADVALEFVAVIDSREVRFMTMTLVQDELFNPAVFVVGSPRSGTTILGESLRGVLGSEVGITDGHLLPLLTMIKTQVFKYHQLANSHSDLTTLLGHTHPQLLCEQMFSALKQQYAGIFGDGWIVDKTPGDSMLRALPSIVRLWPEAHIVFARRRALENVVSRLRKFPQVEFESHCKQWSGCMTVWGQVKPTLRRVLEIDQIDMICQPERVAAELAGFLGLSAEQQSHLTERYTRGRPKQRRAARESVALDINTLDWSSAQKACFRLHCAANLDQWGYSETNSYYQEHSR